MGKQAAAAADDDDHEVLFPTYFNSSTMAGSMDAVEVLEVSKWPEEDMLRVIEIWRCVADGGTCVEDVRVWCRQNRVRTFHILRKFYRHVSDTITLGVEYARLEADAAHGPGDEGLAHMRRLYHEMAAAIPQQWDILRIGRCLHKTMHTYGWASDLWPVWEEPSPSGCSSATRAP